MATRVLIVDDHADFRRLARMILSGSGFDVVGEAEDVMSARAAARDLRPDAVLLDVQLPDGDGIDVAAELAPDAEVVLISSRDARAYGHRLAESAARGFVQKQDLTGAAVAALLTGHTNAGPTDSGHPDA